MKKYEAFLITLFPQFLKQVFGYINGLISFLHNIHCIQLEKVWGGENIASIIRTKRISTLGTT
jgi:hypothetical protein